MRKYLSSNCSPVAFIFRMALLCLPALFLVLILTSCKKQYSFESNSDTKAVFPTTAHDIARVNMIKEFSAVLKNVYKNLWALHEVNATIKSGYYIDERVLLRDLLTPEQSPLYKTGSFRKFNARDGSFRQAFARELSKGIYPLLRSAIGTPDISGRDMDEWPTIDSTNEIWSNESGLCIYFPYSEDFTFSNPYDVNINTVNGQLVSIVTADREADEGPGEWPYYCSGNPNEPVNLENMTICFTQVMINDGYAEVDPVHIVGVGAEPATPNGTTGTQTVYVVFIGEVRCSKQYDNLISFNGYLQGGGPELMFCRGSGYLVQDGNGQINSPQNIVQVNPTRKQIKKDKWVTVNSQWDSDWKEDNLNQVFAIYEEDKQGAVTMNADIQTTVTITPPSGGNPAVTAVRSVEFSWTFKTQDGIIRQLSWGRESFFLYNQGGLNNGCGTRNGFTVYDCNSHVSYTMPNQ